VIAAAAPRRAAALTVGVLLAATLRGLLQPAGDLAAAAGFVVALIAVLVIWERHPHPALPLRGRETEAVPAWGRGILLGVATGFVLLVPFIAAGSSGRAFAGFFGWGGVVVVVATLEEIVIRGRLQPTWTAETGPIAGLLASAIVFALIHLPRYGVSAMPLDFAVGLALAGLRAVTGRVGPCAIAHVIVDWGAWFWL